MRILAETLEDRSENNAARNTEMWEYLQNITMKEKRLRNIIL